MASEDRSLQSIPTKAPKAPALQPKAIACLLIAEQPIKGYSRDQLYRRACRKYSEKAILRKMEELTRRGYVGVGVSVQAAWLTTKGVAILKEVRRGS